MANPPPNPATVSNLLSTHRALLDTLTSFLTVTTHHILYLRRLYPPVSFLSTRAYNYPVRQNRHPAVCEWINSAVSAIRDQLEKNTVERVALCIYECDTNCVLERWTFDLRSFPTVAKRDRDVPFASSSSTATAATATKTEDQDLLLPKKINLADLESHFRATLSRISTSAPKLKPLPEGPNAPECSFTLTIEVKPTADRPVGRLEPMEQRWVAAEPDPFPPSISPSLPSSTSPSSSSFPPAAADDRAPFPAADKGKTHPIRRLEAGELRMELWVEESAAKFDYLTPSPNGPTERAATMSYGAGTESFHDQYRDRFDPDVGYELEPADVNRKPAGGAMTDYQRG